jgi:peptidyl-prolyl cis-trans isomerase D
MFEFVRNHSRWLMGLVLVLTALAFLAPQGYSSFMGDVGSRAVATVDGQKISRNEWDAAHRQSSDQARAENPNIDAKLLDSDQAKYDALEGLVVRRVVAAAASNQHLEVGDERLKARFLTDPNLGVLRNPDGGINKAVLAAQGMSPESFIERYRQDLRARQVTGPVSELPANPGKVASTLAFDALLQRREVRWLHFDPQAFASQVQVTDAELSAYYKQADTQKKWMRPEAADIEYLVLDAAALKGSVKVVEADIKAFYDQNAARYTTAEERRASHILLKLDPKASEADVAKAKAKLEGLLAELRKDPNRFAELAKANSQDEGSAINGGDLDFFARGAMVKPFEDAVYALKPGELSQPVRSDFGWHLIQLTEVRGGSVRPFESVRAEIEDEQRTQLARQRYQEMADQFGTLVFEQSDALKPVAEKLGLALQKGRIERVPRATGGVLSSAKLIEAVFGAEALRNKRNTDAVETAPSQLVSARVITHFPASAPPLAEVQAAVKQQLTLKRAAELAKKAGEARLAQGLAVEDGLLPAQWVSRAAAQGIPQPVLDAVLRTDASKLPVLVGKEQGDAGYWLVKLQQTGKPDPAVMPADQMPRQYAQAWAVAEGRAYIEALKASYKVQFKVPKPAAASSPTP